MDNKHHKHFHDNHHIVNDNDSCHHYDRPAHDFLDGSTYYDNDPSDQHDSNTGTTRTVTVTCENGDIYTISDGCHDCGHHHIINYNNNRHI